MVHDKPWIMYGDFNVTMKLNESTTESSRMTKGVVEFLDCVNNIVDSRQ